MRQRILLVLVVIAAIVPLATGHPWRPAVGGSSVVPGVALADIPIGAPIGEVLTRFGSPSAVRLTGGNGLLGYGFDRYGITVYAHGDLVQAIATTNSVLGGVNGIALGVPLNDVVRAYGQGYSPGTVEGYPGVVYGGAGIAFGVDHNAVAAILVFRPATAVPVQPGPSDSNAVPVTSQDGPGAPVSATTIPAPALPGAPVAGATPATGQSATGQPATGQPATGQPMAPSSGAATSVAPRVPAQTVAVAPPPARTGGGLPDVSRLKAYTSATHYFSIAGYVRYLVHDTSRTWISPEETDRLIRQAQPPTLH